MSAQYLGVGGVHFGVGKLELSVSNRRDSLQGREGGRADINLKRSLVKINAPQLVSSCMPTYFCLVIGPHLQMFH